MGRWGKVDYRQMKDFEKRMEKLASIEVQKFCEEAARELAARLLAKVIDRTPVGVYDKQIARDEGGNKIRLKTGKNKGQFKKQVVKKGGTLRRGWTAKTHEEAESGSGRGADATNYAKSLPVKNMGGYYRIEIINPVHYAPYVEYGHRTPGGNGWVPGKYMLTISEKELQAMMPALLEKKLAEFLKRCIDDQ